MLLGPVFILFILLLLRPSFPLTKHRLQQPQPLHTDQKTKRTLIIEGTKEKAGTLCVPAFSFV